MNRYIPRIVRTSLAKAAWCSAIAVFSVTAAFAQIPASKLPVIIIPGLTGSELINSKTGEVVWFKPSRSKVDDFRLPVSGSMNSNKDDLVPRDIMRSINIGIKRLDAYGGMAEALTSRGGYTEGNWETPSSNGYENTFYVFPYDWRRDNVENAQLLIRKVEELKRKLNKPELKFNIVGHSMGGIIARYAAMYGDADLQMGKSEPRPTWAGARHIDRIVVMGTPSEGSAQSLNSLINGFAVGGLEVNLPFILNPSKFDIFTLPSTYQLLPAPGTFRAYDENLNAINVNLYDPSTWATYGWGAVNDANFVKNFSGYDRINGRTFFAAALNRAHRLHAALAAAGKAGAGPVAIDVIGADCQDTLDAVVIYRDKNAGWKTLFKPAGFTNSSGRKFTSDEVSRVMMAPGDGVVTLRSLSTATQSQSAGVRSILFNASTSIVCEAHNTEPGNVAIQDRILQIFTGSAGNEARVSASSGF